MHNQFNSVHRHGTNGSVIVDYTVTAATTAQAGSIAVANDAIARRYITIPVPGYTGNVTSMLVADKECMCCFRGLFEK